MRILTGLAILLFAMPTPSQTQQTANKAPAAAPAGVWVKLDQTLNTIYTRPGDKISAVLQEEVMVKDVRLPKGTKLTGTVLKSVNQNKQNPNSGLVLKFDTAEVKDGAKLPVKVSMTSIAPSHADEVEQVFVGSGQVTDAAWRAAAVMGVLDDPNESPTSHSDTKVNGQIATSSIKGVALFASPSGKSSGVIVALDGPLQLTRWTRINVVVSPM